MKKSDRGSVLISLLITTATIPIMLYSLLAVLAAQFEFSFRGVAGDQATHIAEAGINYYRWHLLQDPTDFWDGNAPGSQGPYLHDYRDPQGDVIGQYSLEITPPEVGSTTVTLKSTGSTTRFPNIQRTITARFGQTSYASFAFLSNSPLWLATGITVNGRVHSNTGIRQDGINISTITSSLNQYQCGKETGCSPTQMKPGVWGIGQDATLWKYPLPLVDFDAISYDFGQIRDAAQQTGVYYDQSNKYGYHVVFNSNGTFDVYLVDQADRQHGYADDGTGCANRRQVISSETFLGNFTVNDNPVAFFEDNVWVSGVVNGRMSVIAAHFPLASQKTNILIYDNLTYLAKDGNHALGLIANNDIYFTRDIPDDFEVNAALLAQLGRVMRHGYLSFCGPHSNAVRNSLTIYGSLISYQKSYWNFGTDPESGFVTRNINFDTNMNFNPPPYYPALGSYGFISWEE